MEGMQKATRSISAARKMLVHGPRAQKEAKVYHTCLAEEVSSQRSRKAVAQSVQLKHNPEHRKSGHHKRQQEAGLDDLQRSILT